MVLCKFRLMNKEQEFEILIKAKAGDNSAIDRLYSQFQPYITTQSYRRYLPGNDLEDSLQNVRMDFLEAIETFDFSKDVRFFTHFFRVVFQNHGKRHNELNTHKRKINTKPAVSLDSKILLSDDADSREGCLSDLIEDPASLEYFDSIEQLLLLNNLNQTEYNLVQFTYEGYKLEEISNKLGVTLKHLTKIKANLNNKIKKKSHNIGNE